MKIRFASVGIILTLFASLCSADPFSHNEQVITYVLTRFRVTVRESRGIIQRDLYRPDYVEGCPYEYGSMEHFVWALAGYPVPWYDWAYPAHHGDPDRYIRPGVYKLYDDPVGIKGSGFASFPYKGECGEGKQRLLAYCYLGASQPQPFVEDYHIEKGDLFVSGDNNVLHVQSLTEPELREYTEYQKYVGVQNMLEEMYKRQKIAEDWSELQTSVFSAGRPLSSTEVNDEWVHGNNTAIDAVSILDAATTMLCVLPETRAAKYGELFNNIIQRLQKGRGKGVDVFVNTYEEAEAVIYAAQPSLRWRYAYQTASGTAPVYGFKELHPIDNSVGLPHIRYWAKNEEGAWMTGHVYYRTDMLPVDKLSTAVNEDQARFVATNFVIHGGWDTFTGKAGVYIPGHVTCPPKYIKITPIGARLAACRPATNDTRFLKALGIVNAGRGCTAGGTNKIVQIVNKRVGTFLYATNNNQFKLVMNCKNGVMKNKVSMYVMDPNNSSPETIEINDAISNELLDRRTVYGSALSRGVWLTWNIRGLVTIRISRPNGVARLSGIFID